MTLVQDDSDGTKAPVDVRQFVHLAISVSADGGTSASIQFEATADPTGRSGYKPLPVRELGDTAYSAAARSISDGDTASFYVDPTDKLIFIRAVVSAQTGPTDLYAVISAV